MASVKKLDPETRCVIRQGFQPGFGWFLDASNWKLEEGPGRKYIGKASFQGRNAWLYLTENDQGFHPFALDSTTEYLCYQATQMFENGIYGFRIVVLGSDGKPLLGFERWNKVVRCEKCNQITDPGD